MELVLVWVGVSLACKLEQLFLVYPVLGLVLVLRFGLGLRVFVGNGRCGISKGLYVLDLGTGRRVI